METRFDGRVAIVTGGSRGIGLAVAQLFIEAGARVVITGRDGSALQTALARLGPAASSFQGDASDEPAAEACVTETLTRHGRLDILVNNAAHVPPEATLLELSLAELDAAYRLNIRAPIAWARAACRAWMSGNGGAIINVGSLGGLTLQPGMGAYGASKAALAHVTRYLAAELGPQVRVNLVAPGLIRTEQSRRAWEGREAGIGGRLPAGRLGEPEDVARAIAFLASEQASWITGETLVIDGGSLVQWGRRRSRS
jgi:NAD(P)-dependent dehydrogenase (short-subunit alcohol dehydrogenase family)